MRREVWETWEITEEGALIGEIVVSLRLRDRRSDDHQNEEDYNCRSPCVHRPFLHRPEERDSEVWLFLLCFFITEFFGVDVIKALRKLQLQNQKGQNRKCSVHICNRIQNSSVHLGISNPILLASDSRIIVIIRMDKDNNYSESRIHELSVWIVKILNTDKITNCSFLHWCNENPWTRRIYSLLLSGILGHTLTFDFLWNLSLFRNRRASPRPKSH